MKYLLKYYVEGKYFHFEREFTQDFKTIKELKEFLFENISKITHYQIYRLTDLTGK